MKHRSSYSFTVTASDAAGNTSASTTVTFSITDEDDTLPVVTSGTTGTDLVENTGSGQTVYTITATDNVGVESYAIAGSGCFFIKRKQFNRSCKLNCRS